MANIAHAVYDPTVKLLSGDPAPTPDLDNRRRSQETNIRLDRVLLGCFVASNLAVRRSGFAIVAGDIFLMLLKSPPAIPYPVRPGMTNETLAAFRPPVGRSLEGESWTTRAEGRSMWVTSRQHPRWTIGATPASCDGEYLLPREP